MVIVRSRVIMGSQTSKTDNFDLGLCVPGHGSHADSFISVSSTLMTRAIVTVVYYKVHIYFMITNLQWIALYVPISTIDYPLCPHIHYGFTKCLHILYGLPSVSPCPLWIAQCLHIHYDMPSMSPYMLWISQHDLYMLWIAQYIPIYAVDCPVCPYI